MSVWFSVTYSKEELLSLLRSLSRILHEEKIEIKLLWLSPVFFGDSASGILSQFDEYSQFLPPVACGLFDRAVRLLTPRRAFLDGDDGLNQGFSRFRWSMFPVLLCPIASLSSASMSSLPLLLASRFIFELPSIIKGDSFSSRKIDGDGIDCTRLVLLET